MADNNSENAATGDTQFFDSPPENAGRIARPSNGSGGRNSSASIQALGMLLSERREAMGVSLAEVEVATRIRQKYLSALEAEEWHLLPGEVVGRGFLRNYADYLGLDANEIIDRRRAVTDSGLTAALSTTSAGSPLPPVRDVDYRPKEVDLKDEVDSIQRGEIRLTPIFGILAVAALVAVVWWGLSALSAPIGDMLVGGQTRVAQAFEPVPPTATSPAGMGVVNTENLGETGEEGASGETSVSIEQQPATTTDQQQSPASDGQSTDQANNGQSNDGQGNNGQGAGQPAAANSGEQGQVLLLPTPTPTLLPTNTPEPPPPPAPTDTPVPPTPLPLPTATPVLPTPVLPVVPTDTPEPAPPAVVPAACADARSVISSPGVNQPLSGVIVITGSATHENFDYYKLEQAPSANAVGGYVWFAGQNNPISGGQLGAIDTRSLPNGAYTIRLTVVDQTGNFPAPCDVSIVIQN